MDIFSILTMIGGLAMFLYGMNVMGEGLSKLSDGKLEVLLEKLTSTKIKAVLLGAFVTAIIQSSSATTVMVVGFVNSGIMSLSQAVGIIMGANVGTTITSWLLSLTGIEGSSLWIQLLKPTSFTPVLAALGIILIMVAKNSKKKDVGNILLGFSVLMFGMEAMSGAVAPLADNPEFTKILTMFSNPVLGMLAGTVLTAVVQSSSASVGILQALCATKAVGYGAALPIIMGQNIGTCITALMSSIGASKNAKRASMIHLYFNLIGTVIFMVAFYALNSFVHFSFLEESASAAGIAVIHSLFNVGCAILLYPFSNLLVKLSELTIKDKAVAEDTDEKPELPKDLLALDDRFLDQPGLAIQLCKEAADHMADRTHEAIDYAIDTVIRYSRETADKVIALEHLVDHYEDILGKYLIKLSGRDLSLEDSRQLSFLLHCGSDLERISDHALNLCELRREMQEKGLDFSPEAIEELTIYSNAIRDIVAHTVSVFYLQDVEEAFHIEPLEEVIDGLQVKLRNKHIKRLCKGECTIENGIILEDITNNLERVADHCSNIAVNLIQIRSEEAGFETHEYLDIDLKTNQRFIKEVSAYKKKYNFDSLKFQKEPNMK